MKRIVLILVFMMFPGLCLADASMDSLLAFKENVRQSKRMESTEALPDSAFTDFANRALLRTSVDWGGVESRIRIQTVANQGHYQLPDTLVEILAQSTVSIKLTHQLKQTLPQHFQDLGISTEIPSSSTDPEAIAIGFSYWNDTLQLFPIPVKVDTLWFYAFVEHPAISVDSATIQMRPAFTDVAVYYCCMLILESFGMYEEAAIYEAKYEKYGLRTRQKYLKRLDILPGISQ